MSQCNTGSIVVTADRRAALPDIGIEEKLDDQGMNEGAGFAVM